MNLLVDIGNTRAKWRCFDGVVCNGHGVLENSELSEGLIDEIIDYHAIKKIMLSNVGKEGIAHLFALAAKKHALEFVTIESRSELAGVQFAYQDASRLGVDRCLAMAAVYEHEGVLVIDAGSAITADYVASGGYHQGGYIFPGLQMLKVTLNAGTSRISVDVSVGKVVPGRSTEECVGNGLTLMLESLMSGLIKKANKYGIKKYVITGGDAEFLVTLCPDIAFTIKNNLVLDGLQKLLTKIERV